MEKVESIKEHNAVYCPDCKKTYVLAKEMPSMTAFLSGNKKNNILVFNGVEMKRCSTHEKLLGVIDSYESMKEELKCYENAGKVLFDKFQNVRKLAFDGNIKFKDDFINAVIAYFIENKEMGKLKWLKR